MKKTIWNDFAPWFLTIACTFVLILIGIFLLTNINWYKTTVFSSEISEVNSPEFRFYAYHIHLSMIKRSIGLFSGFAMMFLGMGVAFYTLKNFTTIDGQTKGISLKLATASPGIIALITGAFLIAFTINNKDYFPNYATVPPNQSDQNSGSLTDPQIPSDTDNMASATGFHHLTESDIMLDFMNDLNSYDMTESDYEYLLLIMDLRRGRIDIDRINNTDTIELFRATQNLRDFNINSLSDFDNDVIRRRQSN